MIRRRILRVWGETLISSHTQWDKGRSRKCFSKKGLS